MAKLNITLSEIAKKNLKIVGYLLASGILSWVLTQLINKPELTMVLIPVVNFVLWQIEQELKKEGVSEIVKLIRNK